MFVAGSLIQWLRDALGLIATAAESEALARSVADNGGVVLVPAHVGFGAPHWRPDARGALTGLSFGAGRAHIVRAALEAMAHQTHDLMTAFAADGAAWESLKIDGGMAANDWLAQDLADMLDAAGRAPRLRRDDRARRGDAGGRRLRAVRLAGGSGGDARRGRDASRPRWTPPTREARLAAWRKAVAGVLA